MENISPAKPAEKSEATAEGSSLQRTEIQFVFSAGTKLKSQASPQGLYRVLWPLKPPEPQAALQESPPLFSSPFVPTTDRGLHPHVGLAPRT